MSSGKVRVDVECDKCRREESIYAESVEAANAQLDAAGWLRNVARDQDVCPGCIVDRVGLDGVDRSLL